MRWLSNKDLNEIVKCPCCKREVHRAKMMCGIKMCVDCFRTKEKKYMEEGK